MIGYNGCLWIPLTNQNKQLFTQTIPEVDAPKFCTILSVVYGLEKLLVGLFLSCSK